MVMRKSTDGKVRALVVDELLVERPVAESSAWYSCFGMS